MHARVAQTRSLTHPRSHRLLKPCADSRGAGAAPSRHPGRAGPPTKTDSGNHRGGVCCSQIV
eukprot:4526183-Pyramimonas_sp.AAC.1